MIERRQIVERARESGARVLVTLVRAEGSSYRQPGARLLTLLSSTGGSGGYTGTISGGCLEAEVVRKAAWMVRDGAVVERYSTLFDDTAEIPYGLGCGGTVELLLEPAGTEEFEALIEALEASLSGVRSTVLTWLPGGTANGLRRAVVLEDGTVRFKSMGLERVEIQHALKGGGVLPGAQAVFVERLRAPQRLIVIGAGDDARPVVRMAALLGWSVTVVDGRTQMARAERFAEADGVLAMSAGEIEGLRIGDEDAVVVMTHSFEQDRAWLAALLPLAPRYLGLLGARHRSSLLVAEAAAMSGLSVEECCERIYAPVGLDLGGDGPEAIALAVVAEVQACATGKLGRSRRLSASDVAAQIERGGAAQYLLAQCGLGGNLQ